MKKTTLLLFITLLVYFWNGVMGDPISVLGQITDRLQVIVIKGQFLGPKGKTIEEYDYLEPGRKYRLLPKTEVELSTLDGKKVYVAVGPGLLFLDSPGLVLFNGKPLKFKTQQSLLKGVVASKAPTHYVGGLAIRGLQVMPDQEKRSSIHEVDGYAYLGENMTLGQARKAAFANSRRQALEMAKTHIESNTLVKDGVLEYDLIQTGAEGAVSVLEQNDHGLEDNRYHVWIRAEVEYSLRPAGQKPRPAKIMSPDAPLTVKVWTPRKQYRHGEEVKIFVLGNRDFYARIVNMDSERNVIQLLPNDYRDINLFKGGQVYKIPDTGDHFKIKVSPPYGEDQVVVYASDVPLGEVETESVGQGLRRFSGTRDLLGDKIRSVAVVHKPVGSPTGAEFYEATWELKTVAQ